MHLVGDHPEMLSILEESIFDWGPGPFGEFVYPFLEESECNIMGLLGPQVFLSMFDQFFEGIYWK